MLRLVAQESLRENFIVQALVRGDHGEARCVGGPATGRATPASRVVAPTAQLKIIRQDGLDRFPASRQAHVALEYGLHLPEHQLPQ